ncbi:MAG: ATP-binding cassette domain-containing protein, partial [Duncaniella sp.]|nr:ATP-binding cassette domain-containing protein [Duncaniella sp.]
MNRAISVDGITKRYGTLTALDGVSFDVARGEMFGLIGPDGAGKSSLYRILATLMHPDGGRASVCGLDTVRDYAALRNKIGYMPERFSLYQDLSV